MEKHQVHVKVSGKVQGVNYRWATRKEASRLGLKGWVKNLTDGSVELIAQGERESLEQLITWCRGGPPLAMVCNLDFRWEEVSGEFDQFGIRY